MFLALTIPKLLFIALPWGGHGASSNPIAVRNKVISIVHFSPCFRLQSLQFLFIFEIKSKANIYIECTENQRKIGEPNEADELKYSKSLT